MITAGEPHPLRLPREVLAALLFQGGRVYPSCPFAFLEAEARADQSEIAEATAEVDRARLEGALDILRRPDHALVALAWGNGPQHRTPFVGRSGSFVLAFAAPTGECLISLPLEGDRMVDFLMRDVGWAENPTLGEVAIEELPPERFDVFSLEIVNDTPPQDARTMTRAAFAGPAGQRVMVVPLEEPGRVEIVALEERDLRAMASLLVGMPPPPPHPPPDVVVELTVHLAEDTEVHTIYGLETRVIAHRLSAAGYAVDHLERNELRDHVMKVARLSDAPARPGGTRSFRATERSLTTWDGLPEGMADLLRHRRVLVSAASNVRNGNEIVVTEVSWIDAAERGVWRIEQSESDEEITLEETSPSPLVGELLPS